jgi:hypothetical protein
VAIKPEIPFRTHCRIDKTTLAGLALMTLAPDIGNNRKALASIWASLGWPLNVLLTDWNARDQY